jgi:hypothetical protein
VHRREFDWDEANIGHIVHHRVLPREAEQVILNDPVDLGMEIIEGRSGTLVSEQRQKDESFLLSPHGVTAASVSSQHSNQLNGSLDFITNNAEIDLWQTKN